MSARAGLHVFVLAYNEEFGVQGYEASDLVDFVVAQVLLRSSPLSGMDGLIGFYEGRASQLREIQKQMRGDEAAAVKPADPPLDEEGFPF